MTVLCTFSMSLRSEEVVEEEEEEEEEESYGEGDDASHVETTGRKRSLKVTYDKRIKFDIIDVTMWIGRAVSFNYYAHLLIQCIH